jgi:hypothetical protein
MSFAATLLAALLGSCVIGDTTPPKTALFAGIASAGGHEARAKLLQERIRTRFPIGTPEAGLADYLTSQGLKVKRTTGSGAPERPIYGEARATYGPAACKMLVSVFWRGTKDGRLTELRATHDTDRCL